MICWVKDNLEEKRIITFGETLTPYTMKKNMGNIDKVIRVIIAVVFAVLYFTGTVTGTLGYVLLALGGIFLLTSLISFCPLYAPFKINTCKKK